MSAFGLPTVDPVLDKGLYAARIGELEVWNRKYAEVMEGLDRAEALWLDAQERLERVGG